MSARRIVPIDVIRVEGRHRKDLGDVSDLAASIHNVGLLHPVVITADFLLVAGARRIAAHRHLGRTSIEATIADDLTAAKALLEAERDENTCRKEMTPSEKVTLGKALEEMERPRAEARRRATQAKPGERVGEEKFSSPTVARGKTAAIVGGAVGMSEPTYNRAKVVVETSEDESLAEEARAVAIEARKEMDRTGKVTRAYNRVAEATGRSPVNGARKAATKNGNGRRRQRFTMDTAKGRSIAGAQKDRLVKVINGIVGYSAFAEEADWELLLVALKPDEAHELAGMCASSIREVRKIQKKLSQRTT